MLANASRTSRAATCEEWDEDAQTTLPDTRTSAYVAAKRSKPELVSTKSHRRYTIVEGNASKMSRPSPTAQEDVSAGKEKKPDGLKLDTSFSERQSRPYSSGPPPERPPRGASRPTAKHSNSKAGKPEPFVRHRNGECWICDRYGSHVMILSEPQVPREEKLVPQSPLTPSQQSSRQAAISAKVQPRPGKSQTNRDQRPMSFHAGMSQEAYSPFSPHLVSTAAWSVPSNPMSTYPHTPHAQPPTVTFQDSYRNHQETHYNQQPLPSLSKWPEPHPRESSRGGPMVQQSPVLGERPPLVRTTSKREQTYFREPSRSREEDKSRMPPPQTLPAARRPSIIKANTSISTPASYKHERRYSNYGSVPAQSSMKDRKSDPPPSSYREPPLSSKPASTQERLVSWEPSPSHQNPTRSSKRNNSGPELDRRVSPPETERHEAEAEAYQRCRGTRPQPLTVEAVRKISRRSDSGSQRSINSSSRGSSGGKTKTTAASNDVMMTFNGVTLGFSGDSAENHSIKIQPKRNGCFNICVDEHERSGVEKQAGNLQKRSGSTTSSSKQSRRGSEKEVGRLGDASPELHRDHASKALGGLGEASYDDSLGYGVGYG